MISRTVYIQGWEVEGERSRQAGVAHMLRKMVIWSVLAVAGMAVASPCGQAQPPRKHRTPPWHIEPTDETLRKVEELIGEVRDAEITITVQPNRSRLIRTKRPILRFSITNPSVLDVIQYSPTEFELVGQRPGLTTMTLWYETDTGALKAVRLAAPVAGRDDRRR